MTENEFHAARDKLIDERRYLEAANLSVEQGTRDKQPQFYIDACLFFYAAKKYAELAELSQILLRSGFEKNYRLLRCIAFTLIKLNHSDQAPVLLEALGSVREQDSLWANHFINHISEPLPRILLGLPTYLADIISAEAKCSEYSISTLFKLCCKECGRDYTIESQGSLLRIIFLPCIYCFYPQFVTPLLAMGKLKIAEGSSILKDSARTEAAITDWVNDWWKKTEMPPGAYLEPGVLLPDVLSYNLRYLLGRPMLNVLNSLVNDINP